MLKNKEDIGCFKRRLADALEHALLSKNETESRKLKLRLLEVGL
jgi:hypothetical protein